MHIKSVLLFSLVIMHSITAQLESNACPHILSHLDMRSEIYKFHSFFYQRETPIGPSCDIWSPSGIPGQLNDRKGRSNSGLKRSGKTATDYASGIRSILHGAEVRVQVGAIRICLGRLVLCRTKTVDARIKAQESKWNHNQNVSFRIYDLPIFL